MTKTVLVLGASGGVGGETARALIAHGWTVRGLTRSPRDGDGIAGALQREQHRLDAAREQGIRDRERHDAAGRDQADGR